MKAKKYRCSWCGHAFEVTSFWRWINSMHCGKFRYFKCDICGTKNWCKREKK